MTSPCREIHTCLPECSQKACSGKREKLILTATRMKPDDFSGGFLLPQIYPPNVVSDSRNHAVSFLSQWRVRGSSTVIQHILRWP